MAQNYTRQSTLSDGDTITASLFNDEYNQLVNAFTYSSTSASSTGHRHDGSAGQGGNIFKIGDLDFLNKIEVDSTNNRLGFYVEVSSAAVEQIRIQDGSIVPVTTNDIDLGTSSLQFKDLYIDGTANVDSLTLTSGSTVTTILDEDDLSSDSATALVTQQSVKAYVDAQVTAQDFDFQADSGGALSIDLDSETMTFTGGTGIDTSGSGNAVTFDIDSTVTTLTGTQTLTNKTLTAPTISGNLTTDGTIDGRDVATDGAKLDGIEAGATADQTAAEIRTLVESATDSNVFTDADHTKLDGIEASADVTDTANVTAAGALMDSEVTNLAQVKAFDSSDYATAAQGSTADSALQNVVEDTTPQLGGDLASNGNDILFAANDKAVFGAGSDLQIYHDASHSFIKDSGTGHLKIQATNLKLQDVDGNNYIDCIDGSYVRLMHNTATKLETTATGIDVTGSIVSDGATISGTLELDSNAFTHTALTPNYNMVESDVTGENTQFIQSSGLFRIRTVDDSLANAVERFRIDHSTGDVSFFGSTPGQRAFHWDSSADALGIGTVSPSTALEVVGTVTADGLTVDGNIQGDAGQNMQVSAGAGAGDKLDLRAGDDVRIYVNGSTAHKLAANFANNGDVSLYEDTGTTAKFYWDSSAEQLKLGTIEGAAGGSFVAKTDSNGYALAIEENSGTERWSVGVDVDGDLGFFNSTDTTASVTFDDSGNVGIGTDDPSADLHIEGSAPYLRTKNTSAPTDEKTWDYNAGTDGTFRFRATNDAGNDSNNWMVVDRSGVNINYIALSTGNQSEAMRLDSSGNLLVGKTSTTLGTAGVEARATGFIRATVDGGDALQLNRLTSDGEIVDFRKDGTQVGSIGTESGDLHIYSSASGHKGLRFGIGYIAPTNNSGAVDDSNVDLGYGGGSPARFKDLYLSGTAYVATSIGIGTSSPATKLEVTGTGDAETGVTTTHTRSGVGYTLILDNLTNAASNGSGVKWRSGGFDTGAIITRSDSTAASNDAPAFMTFHTSDDGTENLAERMRIDSSGNLLVGTTDSAPAVSNSEVGVALSGSYGYVAASRSAGASGFFNRLSDGDIVNFNKDGTTVGSIGTDLGRLFIGSDDSMIFFDAGSTNAIWPWKSTATSDGDADNTIDIGDSNNRFKDLYLSGGVQFGTTGAAAQNLDDYEEGTWTPVLVGSTTAGTATFVTGPTGTYTKIGNQVTVYFDWNISAHTGTGALRITGLPFALGSGVGVGAIMDGNYTYSAGRTKLVPYVVSSSILRIYQTGDGLGYTENVLDTSHQINGSVTYQTA